MNIISAIDVTAGALNAHKTRMDVVAQNIANAQTTRTPEGGPYQRKIVAFETELLRRTGAGGNALQGVKVAAISGDRTPGAQIYDPGHPEANGEGMVTMPNVNLSFEMVDLISASRAYEANLSVVKNAKQMAMKSLQIGR